MRFFNIFQSRLCHFFKRIIHPVLSVLSAVSRGDREAAYLAMEKVTGIPATNPDSAARQIAGTTPTNAGIMPRREHKQAEYAAVLAVSLLARAAIRGGLDPYLAYNLNDLYLPCTACEAVCRHEFEQASDTKGDR